MQWIELSAECGEDQVESISAILGKYGQGGSAVEVWDDSPLEEKTSKSQDGRRYTVKIYLPFSRAYRTQKEEIQSELKMSGFNGWLSEKVLRQDEWFESLHQNFKTMEIGETFVIKPSWTAPEENYPGRVVIEIDPGAAFGTGLHPTTRLCLLNLHKYLRPGMQVFDLGTGTGILSIAAVKLGAFEVVACDIDAVAVKTARTNARNNQTGDHIRFKRGTLSRYFLTRNQARFDIVLANITSRAISDLAPSLAAVLKPEGVLIVSGIHPEGLDEVLISLSVAGLTLTDTEKELEWYAVIAHKK